MTLVSMTEAEASDFLERTLAPYAAERAIADHVAIVVAERHARDQRARLLPDGPRTPGHRFVRVVGEDGRSVGGAWFWIDAETRQAFLYYLIVAPEHRRSGIASDALAAIQDAVRAAGCTTIGLNVFTSNDAAIALYRKVGFAPVSSYWTKAL